MYWFLLTWIGKNLTKLFVTLDCHLHKWKEHTRVTSVMVYYSWIWNNILNVASWKIKGENALLVRFEVLTATTMKSMVFWVVMLFSLEKTEHCRETYHFHLQGRRVSEARNQQEVNLRHSCVCCLACFMLWLLFNHENGGECSSGTFAMCWTVCITTQKSIFFFLTTTTTTPPTHLLLLLLVLLRLLSLLTLQVLIPWYLQSPVCNHSTCMVFSPHLRTL